MAWTVSVNEKTVFGNKKCHVLSCTADAATQTVDTGLAVIDWFSVGPQSFSTAAVKIYANKGAVGTSIAGKLGCSGFVNGDVFFVTVFGR